MPPAEDSCKESQTESFRKMCSAFFLLIIQVLQTEIHCLVMAQWTAFLIAQPQ
jgi:hypothetical protein